jgi:2-hydroxychromene-2-carboxylate isomerase
VAAIAEAHGATVTVRPPASGGLEAEIGFPVPAAPEQPARLLITAGS